MTDQQNTQTAIARRPATLQEVLANPKVKERFESVLGSNSGSFIASILNAAVLNPSIADCDPISVVNSALTAAVMNLSISPSLGQAAIVPFNTKTGKKATLIVMRRGLVQLALRTNQYRTLHVAKIYEGEEWREDRLTGQVSMHGNKKSDKITGYVAYFKLVNGFEKYLPMTVEQITDHAKKHSKAWDSKNSCFRPGSMWVENFDGMCEKTPLRLLILNWGPMTADAKKALEMETADQQDTHAIDDVIDAEIETPHVNHADRPEAEITAELGFN